MSISALLALDWKIHVIISGKSVRADSSRKTNYRAIGNFNRDSEWAWETQAELRSSFLDIQSLFTLRH